MRGRKLGALMMTLLLLGGCAAGGGGEGTEKTETLAAYQTMTGAKLTAGVRFTWNGEQRDYVLRCDYDAKGVSQVEVLEPESLAGVKAGFDGESRSVSYQDLSLDAGSVSDQDLSPAACLPRFLEALRTGWLLEEGKEKWGETPCIRLTVDTTGEDGGKLLWTVWLSEEDGLPVHGEIAVDEEIIFQLEFTEFTFYDTLPADTGEDGGSQVADS